MPQVLGTRATFIVLAVSDLIDVNRWANSTRTQFLDWGLFGAGL